MVPSVQQYLLIPLKILSSWTLHEPFNWFTFKKLNIFQVCWFRLKVWLPVSFAHMTTDTQKPAAKWASAFVSFLCPTVFQEERKFHKCESCLLSTIFRSGHKWRERNVDKRWPSKEREIGFMSSKRVVECTPHQAGCVITPVNRKLNLPLERH